MQPNGAQADQHPFRNSLFGPLDGDPTDARIETLRLRLHARVLATAAALCGVLFLVNLARGTVDEIVYGALYAAAAAYGLRKRPDLSAAISRLSQALLLALGAWTLFVRAEPAAPWVLPIMMLVPVIGAVVDGPLSGGLSALAVAVSAGLAVRLRLPRLPVTASAFVIPATVGLYAVCLTHGWLFRRLLSLRAGSRRAVVDAARAAEELGETLDTEVDAGLGALERGLADGLGGLQAAAPLSEALARSRAALPPDLPRGAVAAGEQLDRLLRRAHQSFLGVGFAVCLAAAGLIHALHASRAWLALCIAAVAGLLSVPSRALRPWHWRMRAFLAAAVATVAADSWLGRSDPPVASVVFLPGLTFYAGLFGGTRLTWATAAASLALLGWTLASLPGAEFMYPLALGLIVLAMAGLSQAVLPLYDAVLGDLDLEQAGLLEGLSRYRRLVSTLFHDLANPLAVLRGLAALPPEARVPEDLPRARRMVSRMRAIAAAARLQARGVPLQSVRASELAEELRDTFRERLRAHGLAWRLEGEPALVIRQGGSLLRESILGNLVSNALRHSPSGGLVLLRAEGGEDGVRLSVDDQGPGFSPAVLRALAAGRAPRPEQGSAEGAGSGYGLLLAGAYAQELGGRLDLSNRPEGGAHAELWLPQ